MASPERPNGWKPKEAFADKSAVLKESVENIPAGEHESLDASVYRRPEMTAGNLREVAADKNIPEHVRDSLIAEAENNERTAKEAREQYDAKNRAEELAMRDALTGLPNRAAFDEELAVRMEHARRFRTDVLYAMDMDMNKFKYINDTYGHAAGDRYLQLFAEYVRHALRPDDFFARKGGDEFAALLILRNPEDRGGADHDVEIPIIVERVRHAAYVAKRELAQELASMAPDAPQLEVAEGEDAAGVGFARFDPDAPTEEFLRASDEAMYTDKNGR